MVHAGALTVSRKVYERSYHGPEVSRIVPKLYEQYHDRVNQAERCNDSHDVRPRPPLMIRERPLSLAVRIDNLTRRYEHDASKSCKTT